MVLTSDFLISSIFLSYAWSGPQTQHWINLRRNMCINSIIPVYRQAVVLVTTDLLTAENEEIGLP